MRRILGTLTGWLAGAGVTGCVLMFGTGTAAAAPPVCTGSPDAPGVLAGTYPSDVIVEGACAVDGGPAVVAGNLILRPNSALIAAFALNHRTGIGTSHLTVHGNVLVQAGASLLLGCNPKSFACIDDPSPESPTLFSRDHLFGNLIEQAPLGVVVHETTIDGNVNESGGGGGVSCEPKGIFALFKNPVYSDYEDSVVHGDVAINGLESCWLGIARVHVGGNVRVVNDQLADPDAIEILANTIDGNLTCREDKTVWDSAEENFESLFPRIPEPNKVSGRRSGQCVHESPLTEGGPPGEGPF